MVNEVIKILIHTFETLQSEVAFKLDKKISFAEFQTKLI